MCGMVCVCVQVPFQVPLEVNVVLVGFNGDGGYRYTVAKGNFGNKNVVGKILIKN